jgi:hypothetical protein
VKSEVKVSVWLVPPEGNEGKSVPGFSLSFWWAYGKFLVFCGLWMHHFISVFIFTWTYPSCMSVFLLSERSPFALD